MRSTYKKLAPYIREIVDLNKDLRVDLLLGVSISKVFIPSIANTIGTDMTRYKIVRRGQFAYGPVTSRNSDKVSIALLREPECIISTSYTVFEITDDNELLPEYLMMWFRRPEFDRYARFMSHGSVRELFNWDELCDVELPIPSIDKQREIVKEFQIVEDRIGLNKRLIEKLEEAAQAIYRQWFIEFELPMSTEYAESVGKPELEGQPYKSSGGEMQYDSVLEKQIPLGWEGALYSDSIDLKTGKLDANAAVDNGEYPFFTCSSETFKTNTYSFDTEAVLLAGNNASAVYPLKYFRGKFDAYQRTYVATSMHKNISIVQIYFDIQSELEGFKGVSSGTATKFLTKTILGNLKTTVAAERDAIAFAKLTNPIFKLSLSIDKEQEKLETLKMLLVQQIATDRQ